MCQLPCQERSHKLPHNALAYIPVAGTQSYSCVDLQEDWEMECAFWANTA